MDDKKFPKERRIRKRKDYLKVQRHGERFRTENMTMIVFAPTGTKNRLGISINKKTGKAHQRNSAKRLIREYYRNNKEKFAESGDIIIIWKKKLGHLTYKILSKEMEELTEAARLKTL